MYAIMSQSVPIDPPTLSMTFSVNDSPFAGKEGNKLTSSVIQDRLKKEAETNVSLHIVQHTTGESFEVCQQSSTISLNFMFIAHIHLILGKYDDNSPSIL
jgi:predicted membrane GTPase involved in stress response